MLSGATNCIANKTFYILASNKIRINILLMFFKFPSNSIKYDRVIGANFIAYFYKWARILNLSKYSGLGTILSNIWERISNLLVIVFSIKILKSIVAWSQSPQFRYVMFYPFSQHFPHLIKKNTHNFNSRAWRH